MIGSEIEKYKDAIDIELSDKDMIDETFEMNFDHMFDEIEIAEDDAPIREKLADIEIGLLHCQTESYEVSISQMSEEEKLKCYNRLTYRFVSEVSKILQDK